MKKNNKRRSIFENFFNNPNILFGFMTLIIICLLLQMFLTKNITSHIVITDTNL